MSVRRLLDTIAFLRDSDGLVERRRARRGPRFVLPLLFGDVILLSDPSDVLEFFALPEEATASFADEILAPLVGPRSIFVLDGDDHRKMRRVLMPFFQRGRLEGLGPLAVELAGRHARALAPGSSFSMLQAMRRLIMEIMLRFLYGDIDPSRLERYVELFMDLDRRATGALFFLNRYRRLFLGLGPWRAFERVQRDVEALIREDIARRRAGPPRDLLGELAVLADEEGRPQLDDDALVDQVISMIFAGYETTAVSTACTFFWLHREDACRARLEAEIERLGPDPGPEAIAGLPYLEAAIHEAMRLHPVVNLVAHRIVAPCRLRDLDLAPGAVVGIYVPLVHRLPEVHPDPATYRPERFLERRYDAGEYLPFGGGARRCLGAAFAAVVMKLVVATFLRETRLALLDRRVPPTRFHGFLKEPVGGVPMSVLSAGRVEAGA